MAVNELSRNANVNLVDQIVAIRSGVAEYPDAASFLNRWCRQTISQQGRVRCKAAVTRSIIDRDRAGRRPMNLRARSAYSSFDCQSSVLYVSFCVVVPFTRLPPSVFPSEYLAIAGCSIKLSTRRIRSSEISAIVDVTISRTRETIRARDRESHRLGGDIPSSPSFDSENICALI